MDHLLEKPLHAAAESGRIDCVQLLLEHGADVNQPQATGLPGSFEDQELGPKHRYLSTTDTMQHSSYGGYVHLHPAEMSSQAGVHGIASSFAGGGFHGSSYGCASRSRGRGPFLVGGGCEAGLQRSDGAPTFCTQLRSMGRFQSDWMGTVKEWSWASSKIRGSSPPRTI